jgi:hypothetical protein
MDFTTFWAWRLWRYLNPVHFAFGFVCTLPHALLGFNFGQSQLVWAAVGFAHEQGDGELFDKAKGAPREGLKDMWSFNAGALLAFALTALV